MQRVIGIFRKIKLPLRWKLLGSFLLVNAVLLVALAIALIAIAGSISTIERLRNSQARVNQLTNIKLNQVKLVNSALDYMWSKNADRLIVYEASRVSLNKELVAYHPTLDQQTAYIDLNKEITA